MADKTVEELNTELAASRARSKQLEDALAAHNAAVAQPVTEAPDSTAKPPVSAAPGTCSLPMQM